MLFLQKKEQEVEVLKALLAKLQKYGKIVDHDHPDFSDQISHSSGDQKRKGHNKANTKREVWKLTKPAAFLRGIPQPSHTA